MAMFPCTIDGARYTGRQQTAFLHVVENGNDLGGRMRLCPGHFDQLEDFLMTKTLCTAIGDDVVQFGQDELAPVCAECGMKTSEASIFAYTFSASFPKRQFWGALCHDCVPLTLDRFKIAS